MPSRSGASQTRRSLGPRLFCASPKKIIESLLRGLERAWPAFDQTHQIGWHDDIRHFEWIGLNRSLLQIFGVSAGQVDDAFAMQCASSFERNACSLVGELVPNAAKAGLLVNPGNANVETQINESQAAACRAGSPRNRRGK